MSVLEYLSEYKAVRIAVPLKMGEPLSLECVVRAASPPYLESVFLQGQLPVDRLNLEGECQITFEANGRPHSLKTRIEMVVDDQKLRLAAIQALPAEQQREFFRIDVEIPVKYGRIPGGEEAPALKDFQGTINLSGGGLWMPMEEVFESGDRLALQLTLPFSPPYRLSSQGEVVRMTAVGTEAQGAAIKFVEMSEDDQEEIVRFCFAEQRRQLRSKLRH